MVFPHPTSVHYLLLITLEFNSLVFSLLKISKGFDRRALNGKNGVFSGVFLSNSK
jgi:hypothetical protein